MSSSHASCRRVIDVNRTCKVTKGGGLMNFTALVVVGNGDGVVGFATGKGKDVSLAVEKAYARASRRWCTSTLREEHHLPRAGGETL